MIWDHVTKEWAGWTRLLSGTFPHGPLPNAAPAAGERAAFVAELAQRHELTPLEVSETLNDLAFLTRLRGTQPLTTHRQPPGTIWPL